MRFIHTADWHLGRKLAGQERTSEIELALQQILRKAQELEVDAVLVAGDIFDSHNPPAEAHRVAYNFFTGLSKAGIPAIAIAGNHDNGEWFESISGLFSMVGVHTLGRPRYAEDGGLLEVPTRSGLLRIGALPFASQRRMVQVHELWTQDPLQRYQGYQALLEEITGDLAKHFRMDSVNVLMSHLTLGAATLSNSEDPYYSREDYALSEQFLPSQAQYIALGHIHKPQQIRSKSNAWYSGSLIQVDFGEAGEDKFFNVIEVEPEYPAKVHQEPLVIHKLLKVLQCTEKELDDVIEAHQDYDGWLKLQIELNAPKPALKEYVQKALPRQALIVEGLLQRSGERPVNRPLEPNVDPVGAFSRYLREKRQIEPSDHILTTFRQLYEANR